jgi:hypothetical protein
MNKRLRTFKNGSIDKGDLTKESEQNMVIKSYSKIAQKSPVLDGSEEIELCSKFPLSNYCIKSDFGTFAANFITSNIILTSKLNITRKTL